jgi:hypothetical protein
VGLALFNETNGTEEWQQIAHRNDVRVAFVFLAWFP